MTSKLDSAVLQERALDILNQAERLPLASSQRLALTVQAQTYAVLSLLGLSSAPAEPAPAPKAAKRTPKPKPAPAEAEAPEAVDNA